jgi:hypothetical protein
MSDKDKDISQELLHAISADEVGCFTDLPLLNSNDVEVVKQILRGERRPTVAIDTKRAVGALARSERSDEVSAILARIVADSKEMTQARAAAAAHLSVMPQESAERALIDNLETGDEIVRLEVIKSLTKVGSVRALDRINQVSEPKSEYARKQISLLKQAISFRTGIAERAAGTAPFDIRWTSQPAKQIEGNAVRERIEAIWGSTYGISLNGDVGFEMECGSTRFTLLLNDELKRGGLVKSALSRNLLAGLVVAEEPEFRHLTVRYVIMTSPSENGLNVTVAQTNGDVAFVGEVRPDAGNYLLNLRDVGLERMATEVTGTVSDDSIQLNVRVLRGTVRPKKHAVPIATRSISR